MTRPLPEIIRDLAVIAERRSFGPITLTEMAEAITGLETDTVDLINSRAALDAASILRRLDDGTLDVATLLDEPCANLDAAREAYITQYEDQLTAACRALAGEG